MMRSALPRGMARRRSRVPEVRSRRVAMEVTRNIVMSGKMPSSEAPMLSKVPGLPSKTYRSRKSMTQGTRSIRAIERGSWRS